jgi:hypothetical protein
MIESVSDWMMLSGGGLILLAILILWRMGRHDLKGAAIDTAWQVATGRRTADNPTPIEEKLSEINSETSAAGRTRRAAGTVLNHFVAQFLSLAATVMLIVGLGLLAFGYFWV